MIGYLEQPVKIYLAHIVAMLFYSMSVNVIGETDFCGQVLGLNYLFFFLNKRLYVLLLFFFNF